MLTKKARGHVGKRKFKSVAARPRQLTLREYVHVQIEKKSTDEYTHVWRTMPLTQTVRAVIYAVSDNDDATPLAVAIRKSRQQRRVDARASVSAGRHDNVAAGILYSVAAVPSKMEISQ